MSLLSLSSLSDVEQRRRRRPYPDRVDLFSQHDGDEFRARYRLSKNAVQHICQALDLEPWTQRNKPINGLTQLLIGLRFFAEGSTHPVINELSNIHKSTVCRIVQRVTLELAKLSSVYIKMPKGKEIGRVANEFYNIARFPNVAGVLDCTHVKIKGRGGALSKTFRNREGHYSINVQIVCDASLRIRDLVARWPGSVQDTTIFENSHLNCDFESGRYGDYYLIGDCSYYNKNYLLTPILHPQSDADLAYNRSQTDTCNLARKCLRLWKQRCPCIQKGILLKKTSTVLQVIVACAVIHNMCIEFGEDYPLNNLLVEDPQDYPCIPSEPEPQGNTVRSAIVDHFFS